MGSKISIQTLQRMPMYLNLLKEKDKSEIVNISAGSIADELGLVEIQVRKDLASVSNGGKPKIGYIVSDLIVDIEFALGYTDVNDAVLVGAGRIGRALLSYEGFKEYGLNIVAAFDIDEKVVGTDESGKQILHIEKLKDLCERMKIRIGIITVPAFCAQVVCDMLVDAGIIAIWNFAPTYLKAHDDIMIKNENMAVSLAELSNHLTAKLLEK
ncbi:MAG: redox-sensing transcriptional repressor Rex [Clostridia bacterium]